MKQREAACYYASMCVAFIAYGMNSSFPLVVLHNRDEYYSRIARPMEWRKNGGLLAGLDILSQGTWFGISSDASFALVTNYRDPALTKDQAKSRGEIVETVLKVLSEESSSEALDEYLNQISFQTNPFNVLCGSLKKLHYFNSVHKIRKILPSGFYGLSNHFLNTPWPKVTTGKEALKTEMSRETPDFERLRIIMSDKGPASDQDLPETGLSRELEKILSPIFVSSPVYGTRCSTMAVWSQLQGQICCQELTWQPGQQNPVEKREFIVPFSAKPSAV